MKAIFRNKKKLTEVYSRLTAKEIRLLKNQLNALEKDLPRIEECNHRESMILFSQIIQGRRIIITVWHSLNYKKQIDTLYFSLDDGQGMTKYAHCLEVKVHYSCQDGLFKQLVIKEFLVRKPNRGYGSLLLREALFHISQLFGVKTRIVGKLSFVDEEDKENHQRRDHLYQKFGFAITEGKISLDEIPVAMIAKERDKWNK